MAPELQVFLETYIPENLRKNRPVYVWFDIYDSYGCVGLSCNSALGSKA